MAVIAYWEGGYRCRVVARKFELRADEPPDEGGEDTGPRPTELERLVQDAVRFCWVSNTIKGGPELEYVAVAVG